MLRRRQLYIGTLRYLRAVTPDTTYSHQQSARGATLRAPPSVNRPSSIHPLARSAYM